MRRLVHVLLGGIPTSPVASRALTATMADWRHEAETASSLARRLHVTLAGSTSVARVLVGISLKELPGAWKAPLLWRTAIALLTFVTAVAVFDAPHRFTVVLSGWDLALFAAAKAVSAVFLVLPLVAFISEATGRRSRVAPSAGSFTVMAIAVAAMVSVLPEFSTFEARMDWTHFANAATPPPVPLPSLYRLIAGETMAPTSIAFWSYLGSTFLILTVSTVALTVLAYQVRQRRGVRAWLVGISPFLAVPGSLYGMLWLTGLFAPWRDAAIWLPPVRGVVVLASVTVLPLILATHLAKGTTRRTIVANLEVKS